MSNGYRKFDPTMIWVVIALMLLQTCSNEDRIQKIETRLKEPTTVEVHVNP